MVFIVKDGKIRDAQICLYPMKLKAPLKDYVWGGSKLKTQYGKETSLERVAESWELACHEDGINTILNGDYKGMLLSDYVNQYGHKALGENAKALDRFPLIIKLIDAKDSLSVQVHPDDEYAGRVEASLGKTEMWYVVDCEEHSSLLYGFRHDVSKDEVKEHIRNNTLTEVCNKVNVSKGDVFYIPAGTLHAISEGILIAEIQQNSNMTYRIYDYGRVGADKKPRALHIDKALAVLNFKQSGCDTKPQGERQEFDGYTDTLLVRSDYFVVRRLEITKSVKLVTGKESFQSLLVLDGEFSLDYNGESMPVKKGESIFVPANMGGYDLSGQGEILITSI